jgi:serine/threonine protein kinase
MDGTVIGTYKVLRKLGEGGMGAVYLAEHSLLGRRAAIKVLQPELSRNQDIVQRFFNEARAATAIADPGIVQIFDFGYHTDGSAYIVMELLEGEPLANRLKYKGRISVDELFPIAMHVAEAVVAIHAAGVVHRDLKPANIYLTHDEEGGERAKILDFGIARVEWEEMRITNMGAPLGTPGYMSPEQESGGEVDARSDVYAIGAVLYECLVGEPPPPSPGDMWTPGKRPPSSIGLRLPLDAEDDARLRAVRPDSGVHPASRRLPSAAPAALHEPVDVPDAWRVIIERALEKKPEDRFQDARSLLGAIRSLRSEAAAAPAASST